MADNQQRRPGRVKYWAENEDSDLKCKLKLISHFDKLYKLFLNNRGLFFPLNHLRLQKKS
jgi:hypothetical protein